MMSPDDAARLVMVPFNFNESGQYEAFRASGVKQQRCHQYVKFAVEHLLS